MTDADASGAALLTSPARRRVMDVLVRRSQAAPVDVTEGTGTQGGARRRGMTAGALAKELGLHVTTVRFHLDQLAAAGLLTTETVRGPSAGRPRKVYLANPGSLSDLRALHQHHTPTAEPLAGLLSEQPAAQDGPAPTAEEAGRRWSRARMAELPEAELSEPGSADTPGRWLRKLGTAVDALAEWGYTAEISTTLGGRRASIRLLDCPFLALARERPDLACSVHRGLLDGAMSSLGEQVDISLEPFVTSR